MAPLTVSIEGNIGTGKSTLLRSLTRLLAAEPEPAPGARVFVHPEPVEEWQVPVPRDGRTLLAAYYDDPARHAFAFQMQVLKSRWELAERAAGLTTTTESIQPVHVVERCIQSGTELFARPLHAAGHIDDVAWHVYASWERAVRERVEAISGVVYLRCPPEVSLRRVLRRQRGGEVGGVPIEHLQRLHDAHEAWVADLAEKGVPVLTLDASVEGDDAVDACARAILGFVRQRVEAEAASTGQGVKRLSRA